MRLLLWTDGSRTRVAARQWFYDMHDLLLARGIDSHLNEFTTEPYDIAIVQWARLDRIRQIRTHSPRVRIGVLNPGTLGYPVEFARKHGRLDVRSQRDLLSNVSFFLVSSLVWREMLLPFGRRVYQIHDWVASLETKSLKQHTAVDDVVIGYHGNELHYAQDFFPYGAGAIARLAREFRLTLKIVTNNVAAQPRIPGVRTQAVEWTLEGIEGQMQSFDVGICPLFSGVDQLRDPFTYIRNANRALSLLAYGIPSVTSPVFQVGHDLTDGETTFFAISEDGWYTRLKQLITEPDLRNRMGRAGRALVERRFSGEVVSAQYCALLEEEMRHPPLPAIAPREGHRWAWPFSRRSVLGE